MLNSLIHRFRTLPLLALVFIPTIREALALPKVSPKQFDSKNHVLTCISIAFRNVIHEAVLPAILPVENH
jgi:hypothetical protein